MSREAHSNFGVPGSQDPSKKLKAERPDLAARIQAMRNNDMQREKIEASGTPAKPEAKPSAVPPIRASSASRRHGFSAPASWEDPEAIDPKKAQLPPSDRE